MEWSQLFHKKEDWQKDTFEMIKSNLISAKGNRFVRYDNSEESHLVMIYGKSQVGKTTLILNMIGLNPDYFSEVYNTLRAGVPRGNSSTSTAIIYAKSINEQYGCAFTSLNSLSSKETSYFDKYGMISHLESIRHQVERNKVSSDSILFIYIPKNYFIQDSTADSISIMDMPGIESRNHKEDIHVQNLMTKYIPISSVCIIACRSNEIQHLETLVLPNHIDWKRMNHRFILVITHAYNDGSTKRYFKTKPAERKESFYDYVIETYNKDIRKVLGDANKTEVYPVDVGDTLTKLCDTEIKREVDKKEIIATKNRVLSDLRKSIVGHKGERLKSALMDLDVIIQKYGEEEIKYIDNEIEKQKSKISDKKQLISITKNYIEQLSADDSEQSEIISDIKDYECFKKKFDKLLASCLSGFPEGIKKQILAESLYNVNSNGVYLKDKEQKLYNFMRSDVEEKVNEYIKKLNKLIEQSDIDITLNPSQILIDTDSYVIREKEEIYPPKKGFFSIREKVFLTDIHNIGETIQTDINEYLDGYVNKCISEIDIIIKEMNKKIKKIHSSISKQEQKQKRLESEICSFNNSIKELQRSKKDIQNKRKQDQNTLAMYLHYANKAYLNQRNNVILQINSSKSADDKLLLILLLGLLDRDYQRVTGGIHETDN